MHIQITLPRRSTATRTHLQPHMINPVHIQRPALRCELTWGASQAVAAKLSGHMLLSLEVAVEYWLALSWSPQAQWLSGSGSSALQREVRSPGQIGVTGVANTKFGSAHCIGGPASGDEGLLWVPRRLWACCPCHFALGSSSPRRYHSHTLKDIGATPSQQCN